MVVYFKDWADIKSHYDKHFGITGLTPAEQELKDAVASGQICDFSPNLPTENALPPKPKDWNKPDKTRHIRADVLRFVLLQTVRYGEMTEFGTRLVGAQITGMLFLERATVPEVCGLFACHFECAIEANGSNFKSNAVFKHSQLPALSVMGATFKGQLDCDCLILVRENGIVLNLQGATTLGDVFLRGVTANATLAIQAASIEGQLSLRGSTFGSAEGEALNLQGTKIKNGFHFREIREIKGSIILTGASTSALVDDSASWSKIDNLILDGFRYGRISGDTKPPFAERMDWLKKGSVIQGEFHPQPYTQLADTYKRAGHDREARDVRVALARKLAEQDWYDTHEKWLARELLFEARYPLGEWIGRFLHKCLRLSVTASKSCWNWLFRNVVGYGYKPFNSLWFLLGLIVAAWILAYSAWHEGQFAPNSAPILVSQDWMNIKDDPMAAIKWSEPYDKVENPHGGGGQDWETFNSFAYAADIVIPIVEIGQTSAWAPSPARGAWGWTLWWMRWVFTAAGWIISALGAAAITGVIRRE